jgi:hypothetical protein
VTAVRVIVDDVGEAIAAMEAIGYTSAQPWAPPFAVLTCDGTDAWVSGPGSSAHRVVSALPAEVRAVALTHLVHLVDDRAAAVEQMTKEGWEVLAPPWDGPGGSQQLLRRASVVVEVFQPA